MGEPGKAKRRRGTLVPLLQIFCHDDDDQDLDGDQIFGGSRKFFWGLRKVFWGQRKITRAIRNQDC